jgi:hypothetical protein
MLWGRKLELTGRAVAWRPCAGLSWERHDSLGHCDDDCFPSIFRREDGANPSGGQAV